MKIVYKPKAFKLVYTKHALRKFGFHKKGGWEFSHKDVEETVENPYFSEVLKERGVISVIKKKVI